MTRLILSTGNIVSGGSSIIKKPGLHRSNLEFTNSLRNNFLAAQQQNQVPLTNGNGHVPEHTTNDAINGAHKLLKSSSHVPLTAWTSTEGDALFVPDIDWTLGGLQEDPAHYDITVKLFFLPGARADRLKYTTQALDLVLKELGAKAIDLLIVSFPGMSFDGDCEWEADKINASQGDDAWEEQAWATVIQPLQDRGLVKKLGVAEFGSAKLAKFMAATGTVPAVNQINIMNCCNVPPPLVDLAKEHNIELLAHSDCTDILPKGTLRELLGQGPGGAGVLADQDDVDDPAAVNHRSALRGDLTPEWVVKYTAVVHDRGVIENKGYFASALLT